MSEAEKSKGNDSAQKWDAVLGKLEGAVNSMNSDLMKAEEARKPAIEAKKRELMDLQRRFQSEMLAETKKATGEYSKARGAALEGLSPEDAKEFAAYKKTLEDKAEKWQKEAKKIEAEMLDKADKEVSQIQDPMEMQKAVINANLAIEDAMSKSFQSTFSKSEERALGIFGADDEILAIKKQLETDERNKSLSGAVR